MGALDNLTPGQRKAAMYGVPAVAGIVLFTKVLGKKTSATTAAAAPVASMNAIGTSQLSEFESSVADQINQLAQEIAQMPVPAATTPPLPPPTQPDTNQASPAATPPPQAPPATSQWFSGPDAFSVSGTTAGGYHVTYGGDPNQVAVIAGNPSPPPPLPTPDSWSDPWITDNVNRQVTW